MSPSPGLTTHQSAERSVGDEGGGRTHRIIVRPAHPAPRKGLPHNSVTRSGVERSAQLDVSIEREWLVTSGPAEMAAAPRTLPLTTVPAIRSPPC